MDVLGSALNKYISCRTKVFNWKDSLSVPSKTALALATALLIGACAQIRFHLPGTPVPVTGQVFAVLLCGALLGTGYGALSLAFYLGLGYAGVPLFTGFSAGSAALIGVTGGYLVGFLPAVLFIGFAVKQQSLKSPLNLILIMLGGVGIIYYFGAMQFAAFTGAGLSQTISHAVLPFILFDIGKAVAAGSLAYALLPGNPQ